MKQIPLYCKLARLFEQLHNCQQSNNKTWEDKTQASIDTIELNLPSGSGIDNATKINYDETRTNRIVLDVSYHHMDEQGGYDGWTEHQIIIKPSLSAGYRIMIDGRNRNDIKEYLHEVYDAALSENVNEYDTH